ncbi:YbbM seven transmembrane helix protein [Labilithrix luteola]|uniref:YbbM seven transmembrane helix protein n=1 Tax=Labilithrix luteola TaxID=1391654 RepID=A0A0K1PRY1_9BACT|nr:iron export ABC transporter permease subunit FetB [Labilithrix luteola]AKU96146.1 YbbM seven transmembrane helix protein [Labilithrix luteola]
MTSYVEIPLWRMLVAVLLVALGIGISRLEKLSLEKDLGFGAIRAAVQLVAIGYALKLLFAAEHPVAVFFVVVVMWVVAGWTSTRRITHGPSSRVLFPYAFTSIGVGAFVALVPVFAFVVPPRPWFDARYVIPIGGMMLSSAMNVVAQVFERLFASARSEEATLEQYLALGATPKQAFAPYVKAALRAALIPTINGLVTVGLVALPGMMTGQIVSGTAPEQAVRYQVVIMYQLVAVAAMSGLCATAFARKLVFTDDGRLRNGA